MHVSYTLPVPDHWDMDEVPWHSVIGEHADMDGGEVVITGVEVDAATRTMVLSVAPLV